MRKNLPVFVPIITILAICIYIATFLFKPGYIYFMDVTEGLKLTNLPQRYLFTYSDDIGEALAEKARIPLFYLMYGFFQIGKLMTVFSNAAYVKVKIFALFIFSFLAFYLTTKKILTSLKSDKDSHPGKLTSSIAAALGAIFYVTNYWFANRITHFGLFYSTVTIPVMFYFLLSYFYSEKTQFKKLGILLIILSIFTATPHAAVFEFIILLVLYVVFILDSRIPVQTKKARTIQIVIFGLLYFGVNSYWILPYLASSSVPDAVVSQTIINEIGRNATLGNSIRLMGYWLTNPKAYVIQSPWVFSTTLQTLTSFLPFFILIVSIYLLRKNKRLLIPLLSLFVVGAFLSTSSFLTNKFYFALMFSNFFKSFAWVLREYDKFGILLSFVYSMALSVLIYKTAHHKHPKVISLLIAALVILTNLFFLNKTMSTKYTPVRIPSDFSTVSNFLSKDPTLFNTAWYPGVPKPVWSNNEEVRFVFSNLTASPKSGIATKSDIINYLNYLFNEENIYSVDFGRALDSLGVKYLIIRKDYPYWAESAYEEKLALQNSLEKVLSTNLLTVYKNKKYTGITKTYNSEANTNLGLDFLKFIDPREQVSYLTNFTDKPSMVELSTELPPIESSPAFDYAMNQYINKFIFPYDYTTTKYDGTAGRWGLGSLENVNHAETSFYFFDLGLVLNQYDYGHGVVIAKDAYTVANPKSKSDPQIPLVFTKQIHAFVYNNGTLVSRIPDVGLSTSRQTWNIFRSSKFSVNEIKALRISLQSHIDRTLEPHFKFFFYNDLGKIVGIEFMYPDTRNQVDYVAKVPQDATSADFSIWWDSNGNAGTVSKMRLTDVSNNLAPVYMSVPTKNTCSEKTCVVYARLLRSRIGGQVEFKVGEETFQVSTKTEDTGHNERFDWVKIGTVNNLDKNSHIRIGNMYGFNSINAIVLLTEKENSILESTPVPTPDKSETYSKPIVYVNELNPTKYSVSVGGASSGRYVLAFAKPYNENWLLDGKKPVVVNGYINGWQIDNLQNKIYTIEYKPQRYFYYGVGISIVTLLGIGSFLFIVQRRNHL